MDYVRTCEHLRVLLERRSLATPQEMAAAWPPRGKAAALWEWAYCWAQYCRYLERANRASTVSSTSKAETAAQLIARTPVRIHLGGHPVDITFRGVPALGLLARHDLARREIDQRLTRVAEVAVESERRRANGNLRPAAARRRMRWLRQIHADLHDDLLHHTQVVLANALTPDGSDVAPDDAADWLAGHAPYWRRITMREEQLLFWALFKAGPERLAALGAPPAEDSDGSDKRVWREDIGFWSLYSWFFREHGLTPADLGVDTAQFEALMRFGAPYFPPPPKSNGRVH